VQDAELAPLLEVEQIGLLFDYAFCKLRSSFESPAVLVVALLFDLFPSLHKSLLEVVAQLLEDKLVHQFNYGKIFIHLSWELVVLMIE
jgi:hypothetical protein